MSHATDHVYIMGAGRSGTTLLSVLIAAHPAVRLSGELLHFPSFWKRNHFCSCGLRVGQCDRWRDAGVLLGTHDSAELDSFLKTVALVERHSRVPRYLLAPASVPDGYLSPSDALIAAFSGGDVIVDASKYVARALALARLPRERFRYVYIVRDCRGVIHSFGKQGVQEPRGMLSAALYYVLVNLAAQLAVLTRLRGRSMKIRYEDLVSDAPRELMRIGTFLDLDMTPVVDRLVRGEPLPVAHMVSGNRFASRQGAVKIDRDDEWRKSYGTLKRVVLYVLCLPVQLLNRYRP